MTDLHLAIVNSDGKARPPLVDPPGLTSSLHELRFRILARTAYDHLFTELGTLEVAERALAEGVDGIYVDTFGDYAVGRIRALTDVPVVGAGEAGIRAAAAHGRFSVVTVWPRSMRYLYDERLATVPGGDACAGVHHLSDETELERVGSGAGVKARMLRGEAAVVDDIVRLCRQAVEDDRSAAVLLGCTCMSPVAEEVARRVDAAVLDPSRVGLAEAHRLVLEGAAAPSDRSAVGRPGLASAVVGAYLASAGADTVLDECEVCAVGQPGAANPATPSG